ncbi:hypothetical protein OPQ81_006039 [Rhizoctonia solani]|nr:hypothetical protein OPQ81_006039 [Rhizoctonia solani]
MNTEEGSGSVLQQVSGAWNDENKIVVGVDIGTTCTAVSVTYLAKGEKQVIHRILQWPGQGAQDQGAKIPTVIWYNLETKKAELFGAEATSRDGKDTAEDHGWFLVKHFKLHLQPEDQRKKGLKLDPLPPGITLAQIYSDFLGYLLKHTKAFIEKRIPLGKQIWEKYKPTMEVVIAHPNGWDTPEQNFLRKAAIDCGFADADKASRQVQFVTEAEASVHYCVHHSSLNNKLKPGTKLVVCDAGGSTVDTTLYSVISTTPVLQLREVRLSDSIQAGGIFVNMEFENFMRQLLKNLKLTPTQIDEFTPTAIEDFEFVAKRKFSSAQSPSGSVHESIRVANTSFSCPGTNAAQTKIHRGCVKVPSSAIKRCFDVPVNQIISSVNEQLKNQTVQHVLLVGGFGDSLYLHTEFESHFKSGTREVVLANDSTAKAVADGSVIWNTLCNVVSRTPRRSFGLIGAVPCLPWMRLPAGSKGRAAYIGPEGVPLIPGIWNQIIKKVLLFICSGSSSIDYSCLQGVPLDAEAIFRKNCRHTSAQRNPTSLQLEMKLVGYSGDDEPTWAWDKKENLLPKFKEVCTIKAQLYNLEGALKPAIGMTGVHYWYLEVDVCVYFGTTELQAHLEWMQNGIRRKGPATVVPGRPIDL